MLFGSFAQSTKEPQTKKTEINVENCSIFEIICTLFRVLKIHI